MPKSIQKKSTPIKIDDHAPLRNFLEIPYAQLEELNLSAKEKQFTTDPKQLEEEYRTYLENEDRIKAVTVCFSNVEGRLHMLDYDKKFLLKSADNLTFDGSSIRGFTPQKNQTCDLN
jgi:glutamine synthetase